MTEKIVILDFGSQYTQLIARRIRELQVFCEIHPWFAPRDILLDAKTKGIILSGGPQSIYSDSSPQIQDFIVRSQLPVLGICYGMHALGQALGGMVQRSKEHEYGKAQINVVSKNPLLNEDSYEVWMSHGDSITRLPEGWRVIAESENSPVAAMADSGNRLFGLQFHPEVHHTPLGKQMLKKFVIDICGCTPNWTPESIIAQSVASIKKQVGSERIIAAVSGGVDSNVATALVQRALGDKVTAIFVDTGLLRLNERQQVETLFGKNLGMDLQVIDASERFLEKLKGITDPEHKRKIIGETFIREFEHAAQQLVKIRYLVQGTIYPDVVESQGAGASQAQRIKSHHNVGGLPEAMDFELVEPLRLLFKDEVRAVGSALGLPAESVWRQPFPGPGLAVRCLGEITQNRLEILRKADSIFISELTAAGLLGSAAAAKDSALETSQAFAVLLPVRSVGVMGDQRTYQEVIALRAVTTSDFMTADWTRLPQELLARVANRIINEVHGVNRVVYDITSKPPATIEWE